MKNKKIVIIISIIIVLFIIICGFSLFNSNYKNNNIKKKDNDNIKNKDSTNYIYACINDNTVSLSVSLKTNIDDNTDYCYKYKEIVCDDSNAEYSCNDVNIYENNYYSYTINNKKYVKSIKTNSFVVNPKEYDDISFLNFKDYTFFKVTKNNIVKFYDSIGNYISSLDNYELIDYYSFKDHGDTLAFYVVKKDNYYKLINKQGKEYLQFKILSRVPVR